MGFGQDKGALMAVLKDGIPSRWDAKGRLEEESFEGFVLSRIDGEGKGTCSGFPNGLPRKVDGVSGWGGSWAHDSGVQCISNIGRAFGGE